MAGITFDQPLAFDPFAMSFGAQQNQDFSCLSLFNPVEDFGTDFTSDSAASPASPLSPVLSGNTYVLPNWMVWDKVEHSPLSDENVGEPFEEPLFSSVPQHGVSLSPSVNPMTLSNPITEDVTLGREGLNDNQPLFQSPRAAHVALATPPTRRSAFVKSPASFKTASPASLEPEETETRSSKAAKRYPSRSLKRKSSGSDSDDSDARSSASPPPAMRRASKNEHHGLKKTTHNMIEKRYRTNLNDKIAALRDAVPALRIMVHRLEGQDSDDEGDEDGLGLGRPIKKEFEEEDLGGLAPAHKLNKATILSKATEYISHLERKNRNLAKENATLKCKVQGLESLIVPRSAMAPEMW